MKEAYKSYNDSIIEEMWQALDDVPFDEQASGELVLSNKWLSFDEGTTRDDIWHWFDKHYSKGVHELLFGDNESFADCRHTYEELCDLFEKLNPPSNLSFSVFDCEDNHKRVLEESAEPCLLFGVSIANEALASIFSEEDCKHIIKDNPFKAITESIGYITVKENDGDFEYSLTMDAGITRPINNPSLEKHLRESIETYASWIENSNSSIWLRTWYSSFIKDISKAVENETSTEKLALYAQNPNTDIRQLVAGNINTSSDTLSFLANDENYWVRIVVARNSNTPSEMLSLLADDEDFWVREEVAYNSSTPVETLINLANDEDVYVRETVAKNKNTPTETLAILAKDESESVRKGAIETFLQRKQEAKK